MFRNDAIMRAGCTPQNPENLLLEWGLVAEHEGFRTGVLYCETTDASRKLFLRGPLVRMRLFLHLAANGCDFIHSDADAFWLRDPRPWLMRHPDYDLLCSQGTK